MHAPQIGKPNFCKICACTSAQAYTNLHCNSKVPSSEPNSHGAMITLERPKEQSVSSARGADDTEDYIKKTIKDFSWVSQKMMGRKWQRSRAREDAQHMFMISNFVAFGFCGFIAGCI